MSKGQSPALAASEVRFTRIKGFYIPADVESYRALYLLNLRNVRYAEDLLPTLGIILKPRGIRARLVDFKSGLFAPFMERIQTTWERAPKRVVKFSRNRLVLESKNLKRDRAVFPSVEACLRRFFRRWGFATEFAYSETTLRGRLTVDFKLDPERSPIIEFRTGV